MKRSGDGQVPLWLGRMLCLLGFHDFHLVESVIGFGAGQQVDKLKCRRCGHATTRVGR